MSLKERVERRLGPVAVAITEFKGDISVEVPRQRLVEVMGILRDSPDMGFDFLSDVIGVDNQALYEQEKAKAKKKGEGPSEAPAPTKEGPPPPRFEVVYLLLSVKRNERMQVKVRVPEDDPVVDSVTPLWKAADWPEREVFDMFGIRINGHPNLKRLLMWDEFPAHPLRKDYPLAGQGEERFMVYD